MSAAPDTRAARLRSMIERARSQAEAIAPALRGGAGGRGAEAPAHAGPFAALPADWLPGYELLGELHRGGQGVVFRGVQKSTRRCVAIKVMREGPFAGVADRARFEREAQILGQLNHPNIVAIHDCGVAAGCQYFVMDLIEGRPLDQWIMDHGFRDANLNTPGQAGPRQARISKSRRRDHHRDSGIEAILRLFATVCDAVHAAHLRGVIHRDLKPGNIRVDPTGQPHVLDFGLAKVTDGSDGAASLTLSGQFMGSLPWASPEQAAGDSARLDLRTDVYSLGVILFQILTGRFPYDVAASMRDVLERIIRAEPVRPGALCRAVDDELDTIVLKCLSKEPERRYQSAGELANDLRRYLAGEPIEAKRDSRLYMLRKSISRYRTPLAAMLVLLVVLASAVVFSWRASIRERAAAHEARAALWQTLLTQARASRHSGRAGQRFDTLAALRQAAEIRPTRELRNEAIAALALTDVRLIHTIEPPGMGVFDAGQQRCAVIQPDWSISVVAVDGNRLLMRVPPPDDAFELHRHALHGDYFCRVFDRHAEPRRLEVWSISRQALHLEVSDVPPQAGFDVSSDNARLAVSRLDRAVHILDLESGRELRRYELDRDPAYLRFDSSGRWLALFHARFADAALLDLDTGEVEGMLDGAPITWDVTWRADSSGLAACAGRQVRLWDRVARADLGTLTGHDLTVTNLDFSHRGDLLLSYGWDNVVNLWDMRMRRPLLSFASAPSAFGPGDRQVSTGSYRSTQFHMQLAQLAHGGELRRLVDPGFSDERAAVDGDFHPSGRFLITGTCEAAAAANGVRVFDVDSGEMLLHLPIGEAIDVRFAADGRSFLAAAEGGLQRRCISIDGPQVRIGPAEVLATGGFRDWDISVDGRRLASIDFERPDARLTTVDLADGTVRRFPCLARALRHGVSPDGRWVAVGAWNALGAEVWDIDEGRRVATLPLAATTGLTFTPDGQWLIARDRSGLSLWRAGTWNLVRPLPGSAVTLTFSPDRQLVAASNELGRIELFDAATWTLLADFEIPDKLRAVSVAFSPNGRTLAAFTNRAGMIHLWDLPAIRAQLKEIGLDWPSPVTPPEP